MCSCMFITKNERADIGRSVIAKKKMQIAKCNIVLLHGTFVDHV